MTPTEFQAAGLYDPSSPKAAERLDLLHWLVEQGATIEEMQAADARGQLVFLRTTLLRRSGPALTHQELADRLGQDPELIDRFRVAFALPPVRPGQPWCTEDEARMFESVARGIELFGEKGMLRLMRVAGSASSRIAEAMVTANLERMRVLLRSGAPELEQARANQAALQGSDGPGRIVTALVGLHLEIAAQQLRARRSGVDAETLTACVGFVDLAGSTTLSRRLSASGLAAMVDRFEEVAHEVAINRRGRIVKFIGDEVMFVTGDATSACDIALALIEAFDGDATVKPRAGLASGELLDRGGDYYGPVVNLAARLAELAVTGEVLVTTDVADAIRDAGLKSEAAGRRLLRGFDEPVALRTVTRA